MDFEPTVPVIGTPAADSQNVIIVGAGVAGLSLAILLAEQNIRSQVLESRQQFDGPTSGVRISVEGVEILKLMKLDPIGENTKMYDMRFGGLSAIFSAEEHEASAIVVTRLALHEHLMKRARALGIPVRTGFKVEGATATVDRVEVSSGSGEKITGTLLVGADGVGSILRQILNSDERSTKTYAGYLGVGLITQDEAKTEMTLYSYPGHQVGVASCGKVNETATKNSIFLWTHIRMPEENAKSATQASVKAELARRAERWSAELRSKYELYTKDAYAMLAFGPVYNGKPPSRWYGDRMMIIGDAAHPYGPGGQGISMALKDAKALCDLIVRDFFTEEGKDQFQRSRGGEARALGEAAEKRNSKGPSSTKWGILAEGVTMKAMEILWRGRMRR
jgi:2-polyprenyl-6-methoxyphenol hydroxylase-like FAD-dependent oxidoreductase